MYELWVGPRTCKGSISARPLRAISSSTLSHRPLDVLVRLILSKEPPAVFATQLGQRRRHGGTAAHALFTVTDDGVDVVLVLLHEAPDLACVLWSHELDVRR